MKKNIETILREAGVNPALPHLIFSKEQGVLFASKRMCILLNTFEEKIVSMNLKKTGDMWPFSNQEDAGSKIFSNLVNKAPSRILAQYNLHNYELMSIKVKDVGVVIVAKLMRKGDLLKDKHSRQELFRTLSHELRTSSMALSGYLKMLEEFNGSTKEAAKNRSEILLRLSELNKRFEKNVDLLSTLKDELSDDSDQEAA